MCRNKCKCIEGNAIVRRPAPLVELRKRMECCDLETIYLKRYRLDGKDAINFASVVKPYNCFYESKDKWILVPETTIYQTVFDKNQKNLDAIALVFENRELTFREFFLQVDRIAASLVALGVGRDDVVSVAMSSTPEAVCLLYAASKVGATFASMDPRDSANELKSKIEQAAPRCLFVAPGFEKVSEIASVGLVDTIVSLAANDDSAAIEQGVIPYGEFLRKGETIESFVAVGYEPDHVAAIVYTGASTGAAKGVMLSDYSFNAMGVAWENSGYHFRSGKKLLDVLPLFIAYGVCNALHVPLMWGETIVLVDSFRMDLFARFLVEHKPQHVFSGPPHIRFLQRSEIGADADLSFLEMAASGGAGMPFDEDASNYSFFAIRGADGVYGQGYGMSEINAAFCYGNGRKNRVGYIGIPLAGNDAVIVDRETLEELPFGEGKAGILMIKTPTVMLGYHGLSSYKDKQIFVKDDVGDVWVASGDICIMDKSGKIKIVDRVGRGFNTFGMNIYPAVLEDVIGAHPAVIESVVVGLPHEVMGAAPVVNVIVAAEYFDRVETIADEIDELIKRELPSYTFVYAYNFRTSIPYTSRAKPDYQTIQTQGIDDLGNNRIIIREVSDIANVLKAKQSC